MKIQYIGHSCFLLTTNDGVRIVTDPYRDIGIPMPDLSADILTVSHRHYDHDNLSSVNAGRVLFNGSIEESGVSIQSIDSFHDEAQGRKRGNNHIFKFIADGVCVCHMGDLGEPFHIDLAEKIGAVDVLLIPIGGNYTIDAAEAKKYVDAISPKIVIPMHYKVKDLTVDIAPPDQFLSYFNLFEKANVVDLPSRPMSNKTKLILMERSNGR